MPPSSDIEFDPSAFSGVARLFPLPTPILFPRVVQPLHLFEERYLEMMRDALDGDGLIAMAVLKPGWEIDYASRPPLEPFACLGKIVTHHCLDNGRYNLLLAGVARVRILNELSPPEAFRRARVEILNESEPAVSDARAAALHRRLAEAFRSALPHGEPPEPLQRLFEGDTPLGLLADLAASTLPLPRDVKQAALAEPDAAKRAALLIGAIDAGSFGQPASDAKNDPTGFPPPFSVN
ncbi:Lon protease 2 [Botrimarina colliarenosi]|uniref:Lon protease 2 n=1 Tax=Botrimarina colliarenosi TaxID=2528001 RepID=A0A5C6A8X3_9BACT|nr:LON peptidase substrate-binding domain-containing protein [Botrimarina colliarenosi]TWT95820.1 Lon protease 2 [Botrimarina colliarenosi]